MKTIANLEKQLREQNEQLQCISSKLATLSGRPEVEANITACDAFRNKTKTKIDSRFHADTASSNKKSTKKKKDKNVRDAIGGSEVASKKAVEIGLNSKMQKMWWSHLARFPTTHLRTHTRQPSRVDRVADQPMRKKCTRQKKIRN